MKVALSMTLDLLFTDGWHIVQEQSSKVDQGIRVLVEFVALDSSHVIFFLYTGKKEQNVLYSPVLSLQVISVTSYSAEGLC